MGLTWQGFRKRNGERSPKKAEQPSRQRREIADAESTPAREALWSSITPGSCALPHWAVFPQPDVGHRFVSEPHIDRSVPSVSLHDGRWLSHGNPCGADGPCGPV